MERTGRKRQKGIALLVIAGIALGFIPLIGLAIDASVLYVVKARVSAACDGASLAAARNLNVGQTMADQVTAARDRAQSFFEANMPDHFMGATRNTPNIVIPSDTPNNVLTVTTTASATVNTYFTRYLGVNNVTVAATGTASRRDVNLMLVLDRSGSMNESSSCAPMKLAAADFVEKFVDGRDTVGLRTFSTNTVLAFAPANNFKSASTNIASRIASISCGDNTAMSLAYWKAYEDIVALNEPGALNAIVLFTDGIPNGFYASFPVKTSSDTRYGYSDGPCGTGSTCTISASPCSSPTTNLLGVIAQGNNFALTGTTSGLYGPTRTSVTSHGQQLVTRSNCRYYTDGSDKVRRDVAYAPETDVFGNMIRGNTHQYSTYVTTGSSRDTIPGAPYADKVRIDRPSTIGKISSNLMDHAAQRVRARALSGNVGVVTFVIGLGSYSLPSYDQPDDRLLRRVANDPASDIYVDDPELPDGRYIRASNAQEMAEAFQKIASEVLRLSR